MASTTADPCLALKLLPPSSILNYITATPSFSISTPSKYNVSSLSKTLLHDLLLEHPFTSHLMFSNQIISITAPCLWNDLTSELRTISLPPSLPGSSAQN